MSSSDPLRVLIVDDQVMFADAVRALLESDDRIDVVATTDNGDRAVALAGTERADVALVDIAMPGTDGLQTTRLLLAAHPTLKVIVISGLMGRDVIESARAAGASDFLLKGDLHDEVAAAIVRVAAAP
jgi:two-component system, NarL family, response regulator DesR